MNDDTKVAIKIYFSTLSPPGLGLHPDTGENNRKIFSQVYCPMHKYGENLACISIADSDNTYIL